VTVAAVVSQLGLQQAIVRFVAESIGREAPARARAAVVFAYRWVAFGVVAVSGFILLGGGVWIVRDLWESPALAATMPIAAIWLAAISLQVLTSETFRGFKELALASLFGGVIAGTVSLAVLSLWVVERGTATLEQAMWISAGATALSVAIGVTVLRRRLSRLPSSGGTLSAADALPVALPMWGNSVTAYLLLQCPLWIIGAFRPEPEVGLYFGALRLVTLVSMPLILVNLVVPPFIAELYARGETRRLERVLRTAATFAGLPAFAILLSFVFFGAPILGLALGTHYRAGAPILALLSIGYLANVWTGSCGITLTMTGFHHTVLRVTIGSTIFAVVASLLVVRRHGTLGVAGVVCAAAVLHNLANWLAARYHTGMWTHVTIPTARDIRSLLSR
ncbi:MAG TPA: lipopolysaccharide biosynthesis protein, partial [Candidatus Polarisedimenticolaceae bacterium]|nr:lipopolysaccharide biosynthesis protein [Candidatus Polarisedimenticolaceae bacterium]